MNLRVVKWIRARHERVLLDLCAWGWRGESETIIWEPPKFVPLPSDQLELLAPDQEPELLRVNAGALFLAREELLRWSHAHRYELPTEFSEAPTQSLGTYLPKKRPPLPRTLREWYSKRKRKFEKLGKQPSREDDYRDANEKFGGGVTHALIREVRKELAREWTTKGRRATKSEKNKSEV